MKTSEKTTMYIVMFVMHIMLIILLLSCNSNNLHTCNWENCSHYNKSVNVQTFSPEWGYEKDTDGYYIEITHIAQPTWTYEQCEQYVFTGVE